MVSKKEKKLLKGKAHHLKAIFNAGKDGFSDTFVKSVKDALNARELIKIKFLENSGLDTKVDGEKLAKLCEAEFIGSVGFVVILYKYSESCKKHILDDIEL